jgi:hypothetical protein
VVWDTVYGIPFFLFIFSTRKYVKVVALCDHLGKFILFNDNLSNNKPLPSSLCHRVAAKKGLTAG